MITMTNIFSLKPVLD